MTARRASIGLLLLGLLAAGTGYAVSNQGQEAAAVQATGCSSCDARKAHLTRMSRSRKAAAAVETEPVGAAAGGSAAGPR